MKLRQARKWRKDHPIEWERSKFKAHIKERFGITPSDYDEMIRMQLGRCTLCGDIEGDVGLHIDHDHKTGNIRGLLCNRCNAALERLEKIPGWAQRAEAYLKKPPVIFFGANNLKYTEMA
jgi:Recombination endonuclease VII